MPCKTRGTEIALGKTVRIKRIQKAALAMMAFLACGLAWAQMTFAKTSLSAIRQREPSFLEVFETAAEKENLGWQALTETKKKMRRAPWLPTLYAGYDLTLRETTAVSVTDNISVTGSGVAVGPRDNDWDQSNNRGDVLHFKAIWNLSEIVYPSSSLAHEREVRGLSLDRLKFRDYLSKIYAERRKCLAEYWLMTGRSDAKAVQLREKIASLTQELDAVTANRYADRWWGGD